MSLGGNRQRGIRGSRRGSDPKGNARDRRGEDIRFGPEFEFRDGQWRLRTTGALVVNPRGELELEVTAPLAQSSPLRLETDDTVQVTRDGKLAATQAQLGTGLQRNTRGEVEAEVRYCQYRAENPDPDLNLNGTDVGIPWTITDHADRLFELSSDGLTVKVLESGVYRCEVSLAAETATVQRASIGVQFTKNGTKTNPMGLSGYIRRASSHNEASSYIFERLRMKAGGTIGVVGNQLAAPGTVTLYGAHSVLTIERMGPL